MRPQSIDATRLRERISAELSLINERVNDYLRGRELSSLESIVIQIEPQGTIPGWWSELEEHRRPSKTDPKTLGTIVEKLLKCEIARRYSIRVGGSSAKGVDIPELELDTKATSDRQPQSSHPYKSAYERILGTDFDVLVAIYNGERFLADPSTSLQIIKLSYLKKTEMADNHLCQVARNLRDLFPETVDQRVAKRCLRAIAFAKKNNRKFNEFARALESRNLKNITNTLESYDSENPNYRDPDDALCSGEEWTEFLRSPLDGKIGISFALQWRFQFGSLIE